RCSPCCCCPVTKRGKFLTGGCSCLALVAGLFVAACFWLVPWYAQSQMDRATIVLLGASLSEPTKDTVRMTAQTVLQSGSMVASHVQSFNATVSANGVIFGWLIFPDTETVADGPTHVKLDTPLHVTDNAAFTAAAAPLLQGFPSDWTLSGSAKVSAAGFTMTLKVSKVLELPPSPLRNVIGTNVDIVSGNATTLHALADTLFFSESIVQMQNLGGLTFSLHPVLEDGSPNIGVSLGEVFMDNFQVIRGYNLMPKASVFLQKTEENLPFLSPFLGSWASGRNQTVAIRGPVRSGSPFLDNLTTQFLVMVGLDTGMIRSAYISNSHSLRGHDPKTGKECPLINAVNCLRGSVVVVENTVHHELQMTDISFDVDIDDNLSYSTAGLRGEFALEKQRLSGALEESRRTLRNCLGVPNPSAAVDSARVSSLEKQISEERSKTIENVVALQRTERRCVQLDDALKRAEEQRNIAVQQARLAEREQLVLNEGLRRASSKVGSTDQRSEEVRESAAMVLAEMSTVRYESKYEAARLRGALDELRYMLKMQDLPGGGSLSRTLPSNGYPRR
ncbi:unnamed protein product, partial [Polarella glacialis]